MNDTKSAFTSVGIMVPLAGILVAAINQFVLKGNYITDADTTSIVNALSLLVGSIGGIYGRWKATKAVSLTGK